MWYLTSPPPRVLRGIDVLEAGEDLGGVAADGVHHDVQAAAVAHREHHLLGAVLGGALEHLVEQGMQRLDALEREALGAEVARLEELLEGLGAGEQVEDALAVEARAPSASMRSSIQRRRSGSAMCMNSTPIVPQ